MSNIAAIGLSNSSFHMSDVAAIGVIICRELRVK